mmetsp:Transcript_22802/g.28047  ORF Transcript_22802/g.28047 Transcript_22802/m.28047 type:complete len:111 (+) Transcript_22802:1-333(+)
MYYIFFFLIINQQIMGICGSSLKPTINIHLTGLHGSGQSYIMEKARMMYLNTKKKSKYLLKPIITDESFIFDVRESRPNIQITLQRNYSTQSQITNNNLSKFIKLKRKKT